MKGMLHPLKYFFLLLVAGGMASCDVHEFPELDDVSTGQETGTDTRMAFYLQLDFDTLLPLYQEVTYPATRSASAQAEDYSLRHIVNVYQADDDGDFTRTYDYQFIFTQHTSLPSDTCLLLRLYPGTYRFIVWTDYVEYGTTEDNFYDTSDFAEITVDTARYEGSTNFRDAFRGTQDAALTLGSEQDTAIVVMERPLAKFEIIATDLREFLETIAQGTMEASYNADSIDLSAYSVVFTYPYFMYCSYNLFTDRPADSAAGIHFNGEILALNDSLAQLGFDYVFVGTYATSEQVYLSIYNPQGTLIASTGTFTIPLMRSELTTVYGAFFTAASSGGVGVQTTYEGTYNIEIK